MLFASLCVAGALIIADAPGVGPAQTSSGELGARSAQLPKSALDLAELTNPVEMLAQAELTQFDRIFVPMMKENADVAAMEAEYPGLVDAVHQASRELVVPSMQREVTNLQAAIAALYAAKLSESERAELIVFYQSPTGRKLIRGAIQNQDVRNLAEDYVKTGSFSADKLEEQKTRTIPGIIAEFNAQDEAAMLAFMQSSAFPKLEAMKPEVMKVMISWMNRPTPEFDRELEDVMAKAIERHIAKLSESSAKR